MGPMVALLVVFSFISIKHLREIPTGSHGAINTGGV